MDFGVDTDDVLNFQVKELNEQLEEEKRQHLEQAQRAGHSSGGGSRDSKDNWTDAEIQMLIKAVNLFPAGTNSRLCALKRFECNNFFLCFCKLLMQVYGIVCC